ncbi:aminodeoxychorismate synthase, component I [Pleomorphomonas diazotrophica]|uniref:aminodeoxychorismate synthase n=1 Tax=Pleomorphomonas diazotrophica TaxID=1166257 RepID=A0A1I4QNF1_9HYPH|nr:aminodeoxychorismate synthase component I [Pleomorphomonas diazotrophica]PKR90562.1 aminodeoxychorismate synthase, component I [Pleomorphomonas diazotrophica]SFM41203.1 para-aminobenzoate synthetase component 1 [Pleomorphomonas diazotrophica]
MIVTALDCPDPMAIAGRLRPLPRFAFLDSALAGEVLGRHAFLAADPFATFRVADGRVFWNGEEIARQPNDPRSTGRRALAELDRRLALYRQAPVAGLPPFQGGAIGHVAYEFGRLLEHLPSMPASTEGIAELEMHFYDVVVTCDLAAGRAFLISTGWPAEEADKRDKRARERAEQFLALIEGPAPAEQPFIGLGSPIFRANLDRAGYEAAVARTRDYILAGDIFQANIARRIGTTLPPGFDAWGYYRALRAANPAPFAAFVDHGEMQIASSSPERLIEVRGRQVETRPIKGTARRAAGPAEDAARAAALAASEKDRAENVMIVDLLRSDLSGVCKPHTVRVPSLCAVETYASLHHLVSVVTGELRDDRSAVDALAAVFPGGSITGAPKIRAMEIIAELERVPRDIYCGAIGYFGFDGSADFNIAIRTATFAGGRASLGAGGGITLLSDPAAEFEEAELKARRLIDAFRRPA